jgi:hypothetical protein
MASDSPGSSRLRVEKCCPCSTMETTRRSGTHRPVAVRTASQPVIVSADLVMCSAPGMSAEAKAVLGQVAFNDPEGFGAHAMELGQFGARDTRELTQGCVARVVQGAGRRCADLGKLIEGCRHAERLGQWFRTRPGDGRRSRPGQGGYGQLGWAPPGRPQQGAPSRIRTCAHGSGGRRYRMANFRGHLARRNRCQPLRRRSFRVCSGSWANYVLALGALVVLLGSSAVAHWAGHRYASVHVPVAGASWRRVPSCRRGTAGTDPCGS